MPSPLLIERIARSLRWSEEGFWISGRSVATSFTDAGHGECHELEEDSFWFRHRNACILAAMTRWPPQGTLLDVGAGNGFVASFLLRHGFDVVVLEPGVGGARRAQARGVPTVICSTLAASGFEECSIPAVGLFDVLEHVEDDAGLLAQVYAVLRPGGRLYLTVPAHARLWSNSDETAGHFRRYSQASMHELVRRQGFRVDYATHVFGPLPVGIFLARSLPSRCGLRRDVALRVKRREHAAGGRWVRAVAARVLSAEVLLIRRGMRLPIGSSCLLVGRKAG